MCLHDTNSTAVPEQQSDEVGAICMHVYLYLMHAPDPGKYVHQEATKEGSAADTESS